MASQFLVFNPSCSRFYSFFKILLNFPYKPLTKLQTPVHLSPHRRRKQNYDDPKFHLQAHGHVKLMFGNDRLYAGMTAAASGPVSWRPSSCSSFQELHCCHNMKGMNALCCVYMPNKFFYIRQDSHAVVTLHHHSLSCIFINISVNKLGKGNM